MTTEGRVHHSNKRKTNKFDPYFNEEKWRKEYPS